MTGLASLRRGWPVAAALLAAVLVLLFAFRFVTLRSDMADFLPEGRTPAARLMLAELRSSSTTSLILMGIEGAPQDVLARLSRETAQRLEASGDFALVNDGAEGFAPADRQFLFDRRYLLSSTTTPAAFATDALRADFQRLLAGLQSSASPLVAQFGLPDPPGAFQAMLQSWIGASQVRMNDGVWFAPDQPGRAPRALLLAKTRADGLDTRAQARVDGVITAAFAAARAAVPGAGQAKLLQAGPAVFARDTAAAIESDVRLISIAASLLIIALLLWRFRSIWVVAAIGVPIVLSIAAAALAVQWAFGFLHGITLGFGVTMLGVTVDYPVLLIGHRKRGEGAEGTLRRIGRTLVLAVATAALGLTSMLFSGFPGLSQLGLFSVVGIVVAAGVTRLVMPPLIVAADLAPVAAGEEWLPRVEGWRRHRAWALLPLGAAAAFLLATGGPRWEGELAKLSPVSQADQDLYADLSHQLGAPDVGQLIVVQAATAEAVLQREETLLPVLDRLAAQGAITGAEAASRFLPSMRTQQARQAALPDAATLAARVSEASQGLGFRATAFDAFQHDVQASRALPPVTLADLRSPLLAARLAPLLFQRDGGWVGVVAPQGVARTAELAAAMAGQQGVIYLDMKAESDAMIGFYTGRAWRWLALGGAAALVALVLGLRDLRVIRVLAAVGAAVLVTVAVLAASGLRLTLIHLVALQLVAGVGLDYALFFARRQLDEEERARTLRTLVTCNAMTLLSFGLLSLCRTPILRDIGLTVAIGALAAMCFSFLFVGQRPRALE